MSRKDLRQRRAAIRASFERSTLRRAIVIAVALKIAAIVLVFDPAGLDAFDLPKTIVSRVFAWVIAGLLVSAVVRHGLEIVPRTRLHLFVAAFVVANVVAAVFAENTYVALFGERDRYQGLTYLADMVVLYLGVAVAFRDLRDWALVLVAVGASGAVSLAYAALQLSGNDPNRWAIDSRARPFGTFGHPDMFGQFLSFAFAAAVGLALAAGRRDGAAAQRDHAAGRRDRALRVGAIAAAVVFLAGIGVVATRGSALGIAAAVAAFPLVALRLRPIGRGELARYGALGALVLAAGMALVLVSPLGTRLRATAQGFAVEDRLVIYQNAISAFRDRPIVGWGPDAFAVAYPHYRQAREPFLHGVGAFHTSAHDWLLQAASTTGVLGAAALLALIAAMAFAAWRWGLQRSPLVAAPLFLGAAAYWAHGLVSVGSIDLDWFPWLTFGAVVAIAGTRPAERTEAWLPDMPRYVPAYVAAAVGLFLAYPAFSADQHALAATLSMERGDLPAAAQQAQAAVAADGGRARYWSILGAVGQKALRWRDAAEAHAESTRRAPYMQSYWVNLASARAGQAIAGDDVPAARAAAFAAARRAVEVDPNEPGTHVVLARVAFAFGDQPLAQAEITRAIALWPHEPGYDKIAADIAAQTKDAGAAVAFLEGLLRYKDTAVIREAIAAARSR